MNSSRCINAPQLAFTICTKRKIVSCRSLRQNDFKMRRNRPGVRCHKYGVSTKLVLSVRLGILLE